MGLDHHTHWAWIGLRLPCLHHDPQEDTEIADYIIQKAVLASAVKKKLQRTLAEYGATYDAQRKYDGCCAVIKTDERIGLSRTGEQYPSLLPAAIEMRDTLGPGFVVIGEAWWDGKDQFSLISGEFRRQVPSAKLRIMANDCLTRAEFDAGFSPVPYSARLDRLPVSQDYRWAKVASLAAGTYGDPQALCDATVALGGYDGLILRDPNGTWTAGRGTTGEIIKVKQVLSFDLRVLEVNTVPGAKTGRPVHKLVVSYKGKRLGVGSGVPHDIADCPTVGQIVEVEAMDDSSEGLLREPRFKSIRFDKLEADA